MTSLVKICCSIATLPFLSCRFLDTNLSSILPFFFGIVQYKLKRTYVLKISKVHSTAPREKNKVTSREPDAFPVNICKTIHILIRKTAAHSFPFADRVTSLYQFTILCECKNSQNVYFRGSESFLHRKILKILRFFLSSFFA